MKLAEALAERADLQKRIEQTRARLKNNAWVQEGERPAEDPTALEKELAALCDQLEKLIARINLTNAAAVEDGVSITALLARRDALSVYTAGLRDFLDEASHTPVRAARGEIAPEAITAADFEAALYTHGLPDVDLLIRTSGEMRLSNFLLYQCAYAEMTFPTVLWPDFSLEDYHSALAAFGKRDRRFGGRNE